MRLLLLFIILPISLLSFAQKKKALIVAVGNYHPASRITPLSSLEDVKYITEILQTNGFHNDDVHILKDQQATKAGILKALDDLATQSSPGDVVVIHFSMHGQQIRDQPTVEEGMDEEDGWDEALLPYDVKRTYYFKGDYEGENHLRDDDLGPKLINIRNKLGMSGSLLVLIDACHSGTATRSQEFTVARGEPVPFIDPENPMPEIINVPQSNHFLNLEEGVASNMVVISGSGPHQLNYQIAVTVNGKTEQIGALTYAFYKAMKEVQPGSTYGLLFQKIKTFIQSHHPGQIPMIEGDVNQQIFSGQFNGESEVVYAIPIFTENEQKSVGEFRINKGMMDGMREGTQVQIKNTDDGKIVAGGVINVAHHFTAYGMADKPLEKGTVYEVVPEAVNFGPSGFAIKVKADKQHKASAVAHDGFVDALKSYKNILLADHGDMMLDVQTVGRDVHLQLIDRTDSAVWKKESVAGGVLTSEDQNELVSVIRNAMRVKYLRTMPDGGTLADLIKVEIIPERKITEKTNDISLAPGDIYVLSIENTGSASLFYTVLNITPDNKLSVLYPGTTREPAEYIVKGEETVKRRLKVSSNTPAGREFLKIIVSKEPMDLRGVMNRTMKRSEMNSFQEVLDDLFTDDRESALRGNVGNVKMDETGISTVNFLITK